MGLKQTIAPTEEPISLQDLKDHLRIKGTDQDQKLLDYILTAREKLEEFTDRQLVTATWELQLDRFPIPSDDKLKRWYGGQSEIELPRPPLQSVISVKYFDTADVEQTIATTVYEVDTTVAPGVIRLKPDQSWPTIRSKRNAVKITYVAGYGTPAVVPHRAKSAIRLHAGHLYENREASADAPPEELVMGWKDLAWSLKWQVGVR